MEIVRFLPLPTFLIFVASILFSVIRTKQKSHSVSYRAKKLTTTISTILLLLFGAVFVSELIAQSFNYPFTFLPDLLTHEIYDSAVLSYFGALVVIISVIVLNYTLKSFNTSLRFGLDSQNIGKLITSGIFAHSRNPFFLSILLLFFGISFIATSVFFVAIAVLSLISIHVFILKEERFMRENYGQEYKNYCKQVRRYF